MANIEIYTLPTCGYCVRAKQLLQRKGLKYTEISLAQEPNRRAEMLDRAAGRRTVPQIFINNQGIGGSDELHALERQGKLDQMVREA